MRSEKSFSLGSDIRAEYAILKQPDDKNLIETIQSIFPMSDYVIVNAYIFQTYDGVELPISLPVMKKFFPVNDICSKSPIPLQVQVLAIRKDCLNHFSYIESSGNRIGLFVESSGNRMLFMDGIRVESSDFKDSMRQTYEQIFTTIREHNFIPKDIVRFWNYLPDILKKYSDFNIVRNEYFHMHDISARYPAGTGIDCRLKDGYFSLTNCQLLSSKDRETSISPLKISEQCEAEYYGPKFSRAVKVTHSHGNTLFVSGTAAV